MKLTKLVPWFSYTDRGHSTSLFFAFQMKWFIAHISKNFLKYYCMFTASRVKVLELFFVKKLQFKMAKKGMT
jgi:hypothetical protein